MPKNNRTLNGQQVIRLLALYSAGDKYEFIQSLMRVSTSTIHRYARKQGLTLHPNSKRAGHPRPAC